MAPTVGTDRLDDLVVYLGKAGIVASLDDAGYDRSRVPAHVDVALFGIAREAATNIVRHAHAKTAVLSLALEGGRARLVVEDDGRGFDVADSEHGHGIEGMRERARLLGGTLEADARPAGGFRVTAVLPTGAGTEGREA